MGIINFYPWVLRSFRDAVQPCESGVYDYLYLDACSLLQPCLDHPDERPSFEEVFERIHRYLDKLLLLAQPKQCVYVAVDGSVPKAKRARWPRTGLGLPADSQQKQQTQQTKRGDSQDNEQESDETESEVMKLGREFTRRLSVALRSYIEGWKDVRVVLSDASEPGEGEHKIMGFIRRERPHFTPTTRHCIYGTDADLILLPLMVQEPNMFVLREVPKCTKKLMELVQVDVLRTQIAAKMTSKLASFKPNEECMLQDFVFLCSLLGNDFLPRIPSLEIENGSLDMLLQVYKKEVSKTGYLTGNGEIKMKGLRLFLQAVAINHEDNRIWQKHDRKQMKKASKEEVIQGYKEKYYSIKLDVAKKQEMLKLKQDLVQSYHHGLAWLLSYYYNGACSSWCYPFDYAPFASDLAA